MNSSERRNCRLAALRWGIAGADRGGACNGAPRSGSGVAFSSGTQRPPRMFTTPPRREPGFHQDISPPARDGVLERVPPGWDSVRMKKGE
jgi:hypothetical protein